MDDKSPSPSDEKPAKGYGKRPMWQWVVIYLVVAVVVYFVVYLLFFKDSNSAGGGLGY